jgi:hypothetical protein
VLSQNGRAGAVKDSPSYTDVLAACEYVRLTIAVDMAPEIRREVVQATMRIFNAWVETMDLGET